MLLFGDINLANSWFRSGSGQRYPINKRACAGECYMNIEQGSRTYGHCTKAERPADGWQS